ncbi:hypothetical protein EAH87_14140 [Sphingomonas koreensis]|nr:hypothetical protein EAH87_14140 [Sphingomonas koreensis]
MTKKTPLKPAPSPVKGGLLAVPAVGGAIAKVPGATATNTERDGDVVLVSDTTYVTSSITVPAEQVFFDKAAKPAAKGKWLGEADKVSWLDPASGYECIMLRDTQQGYLCGYVGVPSTHPLHGFEHDAIPAALGIEVHGGLEYSKICQAGPTPEKRRIAVESRRICHVPREYHYAETVHGSDHRVQDRHAWWFGFECNHAHDLVPGDRPGTTRTFRAETGTVYRDDAYVCREILNLAAQLKAVADGAPMPERDGPPLPPAALDPRRGR